MQFLLVSPFLRTCERFDTYEAAVERRLVIGTLAWKIYRAEEV